MAPESTMLIGDPEADVCCGRAAGCLVGFASRGYAELEELASTPDIVFASSDEVVASTRARRKLMVSAEDRWDRCCLSEGSRVLIIEIAGIDGAGKSAQVARLSRTAQQCEIPCYERSLRSTARRIVSGIASQHGHASWREMFDRQAVELATALEMCQLFHATVVPIRFPGQIIVTDTYVRSWLAVAIAEGKCDVEQLGAIYRSLPDPDVCVQLDCDVDVAFERILARAKGDHLLRTGGRARLERLAEAYGKRLDDLAGYAPEHVSSMQEEGATATRILDLVGSWAEANDPVLLRRLATAGTGVT